MRNGLSGHIDRIHNMMTRANHEDGFWNEACSESYSLENLYKEVEQEMEGYHHPSIDITNYYREYGTAIAIVRTVYQGQCKGITGLKREDVEDIESGDLIPSVAALTCYADTLGLSLDEFLEKVATNVDVLIVFEAIA